MKNNTFLYPLLFILLASQNIFAQTPFRIGASFNIIFPSVNYTEFAKTGVGGTFETDYSLAPNYVIILSSTYSNLTSKIPQIGVDGKAIDFTIKSFDFLFGGRYNFNYSLFALVKTGVSYIKLHANIYDAPSYSKDGTSTNFEPYYTIATGAGYRYNLAKDKSDFEFSAIYKFVNGDVINLNTFHLKASLLIYL